VLGFQAIVRTITAERDVYGVATRPPEGQDGVMTIPFAKLASPIAPLKRWTRFSLATMFVSVAVVCVWLAIVASRANRQRQAVAAIKSMGGEVAYGAEINESAATLTRQLLRRWLPRDCSDDVVWVRLPRNAGDAQLVYLLSLPNLETIWLENSQVTDAGLDQLSAFTNLRRMYVGGTRATYAGVVKLRRALPECRIDRYDRPL
jgi:hypothetical protein